MAGINSRELQEVLVLQVKLPAKGGEVKKKKQQRRIDGSIPGGCWKSSAPSVIQSQSWNIFNVEMDSINSNSVSLCQQWAKP